SDWFAAEKSTKDRIREPGRTLTEEEITIDVDHPPVEALGTDFSSNIYSLAKRTSANLVIIAVSGLMLQLKAKELSDDPSFKAFHGWYEKWKRHHFVSMQTKTTPGTMIACG
ncbi:unnamed protein product, partial [Porites lobata]